MKFRPDSNIPLSLAVWLATDNYKYSADPKTFSATTLLKSTKAIVLERALAKANIESIGNLSSMVPSRMGTAFHDAIERSWKTNYIPALHSIGYFDRYIKKIRINPDKVEPGTAPLFLEKRTKRALNDFTITGAFDFCFEGKLTDFKSTSIWAWIFGTNDEKYRMQGSIYRWLNPEIITADTMDIAFIFTDWSATAAKQTKDYPSSRILSKELTLHSLDYTEQFLASKLAQIQKYSNIVSQDQLPPCTDEELWRKDPVYKYYKNPAKRSRSTKNFTTAFAANTRLAADNNVGVVVEVPGKIVACRYCSCVDNCNQASAYLAEGLLELT